MTHLVIAVSWSDPSIWLVLAAIVLIWFSISRSQRRWGRTSSRKMENDDQDSDQPQDRFLQVHSGTLNQWEIQMHELARDIEGRINTKVKLLEQFIQEADRAAARLETALRAAEQIRKTQAAGMLPGLSSPASAVGFGVSSTAGPDHTVMSESVTTGESQLQLKTVDNTPSGDRPSESSPPSDAVDSAGKGHPRRSVEEIYTLSDYGYSVEEIAQRTATPIGEVQLILSLRKNRPFAEDGH